MGEGVGLSEIALARIEPGVFVIKEEIFSFDISSDVNYLRS